MFQKESSLKPRDVRVLGVHVFDARLRAECVHLGVTFIGVEGGSCLHAPKRTVLILYVMHPLVKQSSIVFTFLAWPIRRSCCAPRNTTQRDGSRFRVLPMTLFYSVRHPPSFRFLLKNKHAEEAPSHIWPPQKRLVFTLRARVRGVCPLCGQMSSMRPGDRVPVLLRACGEVNIIVLTDGCITYRINTVRYIWSVQT